jgi:hypothetical protein
MFKTWQLHSVKFSTLSSTFLLASVNIAHIFCCVIILIFTFISRNNFNKMNTKQHLLEQWVGGGIIISVRHSQCEIKQRFAVFHKLSDF